MSFFFVRLQPKSEALENFFKDPKPEIPQRKNVLCMPLFSMQTDRHWKTNSCFL